MKPEDQEKMLKFRDMVLEKNKVMNLTAITDPEEFYVKHLLDSVMPLPYFDLLPGELVADLGTGAGFPGIPLAILRPDVTFVLIDSLKKRLSFIEEVIRELGLKNVRLVHGRFEDIGQMKEHREKYDALVTRAVAPLNVLFEYSTPLLKIQKEGFCYKSVKVQEEIAQANSAMKALDLMVTEIYSYDVEDLSHNIVRFKKLKKTNAKYPRKAGTPSKEPL